MGECGGGDSVALENDSRDGETGGGKRKAPATSGGTLMADSVLDLGLGVGMESRRGRW